MFKVSPTSLQTFVGTPNYTLEDHVQYSTVHIPNVSCDGHLQIISCVWIVRIHWVFHRTPEKKIGRRKIRRSWRPNRCWTSCVYSPPHWNTCSTRNVHSSTDNTIITTHVFLASLLGSIWLLGNRPPGPGGN